MHVGALDAEMMPELLGLYKSKGFEFVSPRDAESDPFYANDVNLGRNEGPDSLEGAFTAKHIPLPPLPTPPLDFDRLCR